ncbi:hypothetical protein [Streptomyces antibioticus]|uniref:hypothetical protein n=1 Tax=Streptomyces antibioticus TaxID=1890 RepID=UPI0033B34AFF
MEQATATTPTASTPTTDDQPQRAAYQRARATADRIVDRISVLPNGVEVRIDGAGFAIRLHFGSGKTAARGVLAVAGITETDPTREESPSGIGTYIECTTTVDGIPLIARALVTAADADHLLQQTPPTPAAPAAQPIPLSTALATPADTTTPEATAIGGTQ